MRNERLVVSRERLLDEVWGYDPTAATNTIDVFISNLRRKLEAGGEPRLLHTKRGAGYVLKDCGGDVPRHAEALAAAAHWPVRWRLAAASAGPHPDHPARLRRHDRQDRHRADPRDFNSEVRGAAQTLAAEIHIVYAPSAPYGRGPAASTTSCGPTTPRLGSTTSAAT